MSFADTYRHGQLFCLRSVGFYRALVELKGWDANEILFTFTVAMWVGSPSIIIGGKICSKIGPKKVICVAGLLYGLAIVVSAFVTSVAAFIVLQGVVASFFMFCISVATLDNIGTLYPISGEPPQVWFWREWA